MPRTDAVTGRLTLNGCVVDLDRREVLRRGERLALTALEARLLACLASRAGRVVSAQELLVSVWEYHPDVRSRAPTHAVRRLREKLEQDPARPVHLVTAFGQGFRLELAVDPTPPPPTPEVEQLQDLARTCLRALAAHRLQGPLDGALLLAERVVSTTPEPTPALFLELAVLRRLARDFAGASGALDKADPADPRVGLNRGLIATARGDTVAALAHFGEAEALAPRPRVRASLRSGESVARRLLGEPEAALVLAREALARFEALDEPIETAQALGNVAVLQAELGALDEAQESYALALAAHDALGHRRAAAVVRGNLGLLHQRRGDLDRAGETLEGAIEACEEQGRRHAAAAFRSALAEVQEAQGRAEAAGAAYDCAGAVLGEAPLPRLLVEHLARRAGSGIRPLSEAERQEADQLCQRLGLGPESEVGRRLRGGPLQC